ncbi:hypothetical protein DL96DRAFT_1708417 [Flagelloscypha sp. PMI_526]|nr:hypothetical protein DL96DRAFT_1708417 [Flagelloscypha sp. PMI_526]
MSVQDHALNVLHNMSARLGLQVTWEQTQGGYAHAPSWEVVVYVNGIEYGRAVHRRLQDARTDAARRAVAQLRQQYGLP